MSTEMPLYHFQTGVFHQKHFIGMAIAAVYQGNMIRIEASKYCVHSPCRGVEIECPIDQSNNTIFPEFIDFVSPDGTKISYKSSIEGIKNHREETKIKEET